MLMVGSFDDKVKVWVVFHNSVFLSKYVLEVVEKLQFIWTMQKCQLSLQGYVGCWEDWIATTHKKFQKIHD